MAHDETRIREFARSYTAAWCSHDPARVADHFVTGGTIAINGGDPTEITEVAQSFVDAFPDIEVFMDDVVIEGEAVEYHWTFTGTNTGPGGTGKVSTDASGRVVSPSRGAAATPAESRLRR